MLWRPVSEGGCCYKCRIWAILVLLWNTDSKGGKSLFCFPAKQYLIHQKMILITIFCQKNDQEDLRGEKVSALEANKCLCQNTVRTGRDWPEQRSILGTFHSPSQKGYFLTALWFWIQALYAVQSKILPDYHFLSFPVREFIVLVMKILIQWSQKPKTGNYFLSASVNKAMCTCLKWFLKWFGFFPSYLIQEPIWETLQETNPTFGGLNSFFILG